MKKILILTAATLVFAAASCTRDGVPAGELTSDQLKDIPAAARELTAGNYSMFKDALVYKGGSYVYTANTYVRHYMQMAEFRSDNANIEKPTTDALNMALTYTDHAGADNNAYLWWIGYRIIYGANAVIESLGDDLEDEFMHIKGENYFLRALCHLHLVNLFAWPYSHGTENPGVVIRTSTDTSETIRATVGAVYDQIEKDLVEAIRLMDKGASVRVKNKGYANKEAAQGLLTRVYLHMGKHQEVIDLVAEMLGGNAPDSRLDTDVENYFKTALDSKETLWAVAHTLEDSKAKSSIASMFYFDSMTDGWGEMFYSDTLIDLFERYPDDLRYTSYCHLYVDANAAADAMQARWPVVSENGNAYNELRDLSFDGTNYYFMEGSTRINVESKIVNTYTQYYVKLNGTTETPVRIARKADIGGYLYPRYFMKKYSGQNGDMMLSSPVYVRWAEVILNRAEAYAKIGSKDAEALADVNVLRTRAGLAPAAMFDMTNYSARGYATVLDVVLDERRLELCFEGFRATDLVRNNKPVNRMYPCGASKWEVIQPTDPRFLYRIPNDEILISGIQQNQ